MDAEAVGEVPITATIVRMAWWGKIIGGAFGYMLGGPLGALLGATLGHNVDAGLAEPFEGAGAGRARAREGVQGAFFTATFAVMGHICKADGRVSNSEIDLARSLIAQMDLSPAQARTAMRLFNEGKAEGFPLDAILRQLRAALQSRSRLARMFIEIQLAAACADGHLDAAERRLLLHVCAQLGFSSQEFERLEAMAQAEASHGRGAWREEPGRYQLGEAFAILNLKPTASNDEVKRAYRRLMNQHHPDKLLARGMPEEMMRVATEKTREIRESYERIREARGF